MMRTQTIPASLTRAWLRCYTVGVSGDERDARRDEIESDLWEHEHDLDSGGLVSRLLFGLSVMSRLVRGMPADLFWRFGMEGPTVKIDIPFERVAGGLLLALVAMFVITAGISGYDTRADGFGDELRRLAALGATSHNANAVIRAVTGLALIAAAAGLYVALRERGRMLSTTIAFGLLAAGGLVLAAAALQLALVDLADEYVTASGAHQEQVLVTARGVALVVQSTVMMAMLALLVSSYALAVLAAREHLVPGWPIGLPGLSLGLFGAAAIARAAGEPDWGWAVMMSGFVAMLLWLIIGGLWLLFTPREETASVGALPAVSSR